MSDARIKMFSSRLPAVAVVMGVLLAFVAGRGLAADEQPVSFSRDVMPIFKADCIGCHKPEKMKGKLDMSTHEALIKGGKNGAAIVPGDPTNSLLIEMISGEFPDMPEDGDPLKPEQIDLISRWIKQGAIDDSPSLAEAPVPSEPPVYNALPVISTLAISPDGSLIAVAGYHEVLLHRGDGSSIVGRLVGAAPRIETVVFSADGKLLAACGGSPGQFGHVQIWNVADQSLVRAEQISGDSLYGVSFSPDASTVAFGGADKIVRRLTIADGKITLDFRAHTDWVLTTSFTHDGKRLLSGSRDKAMKLIDLATSRFIDDINNPLEAVVSMARHPKEDIVLYGGDLGTPRIYNISDNQKRTNQRLDTNLVREFERQDGPVTAVAYSPDAKRIAVGSDGLVRIYETESGKRLRSLDGHNGPVYAISFQPDGKRLISGGFDGRLRIFEVESGKLISEFSPVPLAKVAEAADHEPVASNK